jgi:small subunit ribosomal protein S15e
MANKEETKPIEEQKQEKKKTSFKKSTFRGLELESLIHLAPEKLVKLFKSRQRRRFQRGLKVKYSRLVTKLRKAKKEQKEGEKPKAVKTHLRNCVIVPEMVNSVVDVYGGKSFNTVEIKTEMIGHYLGEFSISYKPVQHGKPGQGSTHSSKHMDKK